MGANLGVAGKYMLLGKLIEASSALFSILIVHKILNAKSKQSAVFSMKIGSESTQSIC